MNNCTQLFCGCQVFQINDKGEINFDFTIYISIIFSTVVAILAAKVGNKWFIFKDYYPLKQKSPILCIFLLLAISLQIILYPILYMLNYFTYTFQSTKNIFRTIQIGIQYAPYLIYFVRSMRILYAHQTHTNRSKSIPFKIFKSEYILIVIITSILLLRSLVVAFDPFEDKESHFMLVIQYTVKGKQKEGFKIVQIMLSSIGWQALLIYCLWLQKNVRPRYSMKRQLLLIIIEEMLLSLANITIGLVYKGRPSILKDLCQNVNIYPVTEIIRVIKLSSLFFISILFPLTQKKVYHQLLPTGRDYGFVKTTRDFLKEQEFMRVFQKYVQLLDQQSGTDDNKNLLRFWKDLLILRSKNKEPEESKLHEIQKILLYAEDSIQSEHSLIIVNLKQSIMTLQDQSIISSEFLKQKHRKTINQKVDDLEKIALQKLDKIYNTKYMLTESYYNMRDLTKDNKQINMNMIMLNLALIVDSENQFI